MLMKKQRITLPFFLLLVAIASVLGSAGCNSTGGGTLTDKERAIIKAGPDKNSTGPPPEAQAAIAKMRAEADAKMRQATPPPARK